MAMDKQMLNPLFMIAPLYWFVRIESSAMMDGLLLAGFGFIRRRIIPMSAPANPKAARPVFAGG
jgi:hypothetical protein